MSFQKVILISLSFLVVGCSHTQGIQNQYSYLQVNHGAEIIPAVVKNPHPKCKANVMLARLDSQPEMQVYVNLEEGGAVCK